MAERLLMGNNKLIPCFDLLFCEAFAFPTHKISNFYSYDSLPDPTGERMSEHLLRGAWLLAGVKPRHEVM